ncbi:MAG: 4-(cytidine 5'-diphospho)-2-C-methyl-D-erythritol kinase [Bacteroidetes bacterium]|nr:4-(cytidine 5'-diphospho)-2-C-methyl-D-erythritol kinase [Bacteroidota bacterium]
MIVFPNAKINIGLNVTEKRPDGFHNIETVFYPIGLSDILEINPSDTVQFTNSGLVVEDKNFESNLCYKAFKLLHKNFDLNPVNIHLHKIIPFGAGLGGGSSDATFTLKTLNSIYKLNLDNQELLKYAEKIGSDCPFFILNKPSYAEGKGEILSEIDLKLKGYHLVIIHPGIHVDTASAYLKIKPAKPEVSIKELIKQPLVKWKEFIKNDFEGSVFQEQPKLKDIKKKLYDLGALYASMSGSGSAIYGFFDHKPNVQKYFEKYFVWTESL